MVRRAKSFEEGAAAYERLRPEFPEALFVDLVTAAGERLDRGVLETAAATTYVWNWGLPVGDYLGLLATTSQYAVADPDNRGRLLDALGPVLGEDVRLNGRTLMLSTRRRTID